MEFYEVITSRRSVRAFQSKAVPRDVLERIISAAASAPSSENEQPWEFYVATGAARLRLGRVVAQTTVYLTEYMDVLGPARYEQAVSWYSSLGDAPVLIAVAIPDSEDEFKRMNRLISMGTALENLLLSAHREGLGACPLTFSYWVKDEVSDVLGVPSGRSVVSIVALGWPAAPDTPAPEKRSPVAIWRE
jgi:nitroreductase